MKNKTESTFCDYSPVICAEGRSRMALVRKGAYR